MAVEFSVNNPLVECFIFHATVVVLKLMCVGIITSYHRIAKKAYANQEDVQIYQGKVAVNQNHPDVERARRNHLNDIENIVPFVLVGIMYVMTGPALATARLHFRIFTAARFIHTFIYQFAIPQPSRALAHVVSMGTVFSMAYHVITATMKAM